MSFRGKDPRDPKPVAMKDIGTLVSVYEENEFKALRISSDFSEVLDAIVADPSAFGSSLIRQMMESASPQFRIIGGCIQLSEVILREDAGKYDDCYKIIVRRSAYDKRVVVNAHIDYLGKWVKERRQRVTPDFLEQIQRQITDPVGFQKPLILIPEDVSVNIRDDVFSQYKLRLGEAYDRCSVTRTIGYCERGVEVRMQSGYIAKRHYSQEVCFPGLQGRSRTFDFTDLRRVSWEGDFNPNAIPKKVEPTTELRKMNGLYKVRLYKTKHGLRIENEGPEVVPLFFYKK
jgi:hypothetical protein